jgi:hypothetical protein
MVTTNNLLAASSFLVEVLSHEACWCILTKKVSRDAAKIKIVQPCAYDPDIIANSRTHFLHITSHHSTCYPLLQQSMALPSLLKHNVLTGTHHWT